MFARSITVEEVKAAVLSGEAISEYPTDQPYPSRLMLGFPSGRPLHVVVAQQMADTELIIVTAYEPDPALWEPGFRERKKP